MKRLQYQKYTDEFREEAIMYALNSDESMEKIAEELGIPTSTLTSWVRKYKRKGIMKNEQRKKPLEKEEAELTRLRRENARLKEDLEILKKAAAYFAKESL